MRRPIAVLSLLSVTVLFAADAQAISKKAELAEKLYLQGNYQSAAYECERLFRQYDIGEFKSDIAFLAGLSYLNLKDYTKAKKFFGFVLNNSDDSYLLSEAQTAMAGIVESSPSIEAPSFYSVQVGSFKDKKNAVRLFKKFKRRKYTVRITEDKDGSVTIYKVKIGRFKTRESTVRFAKKLRRIGYQTAIVPY